MIDKKKKIIFIVLISLILLFGIFTFLKGTYSLIGDDIQNQVHPTCTGCECDGSCKNPTPGTPSPGDGGDSIIDIPTDDEPSFTEPINTNVDENAQTGSTAVYVVFAIALVAGTFAFLYYRKNGFNQM